MPTFLNRLTIILGILTLGLNQWLEGLYNGVSYGAWHVGNYLYPSANDFYITDADPYMYINRFQIQIGFSILLFLALKLFEKNLPIKIFLLIPLGYALFNWFGIESISRTSLEDTDIYIDVLRETATTFWVFSVFLFALPILQLFSIVAAIYHRPKTEATIDLS